MNYAEMGIGERNKRGQDELDFKRKSIDKCGKLLVVGEKVISVITSLQVQLLSKVLSNMFLYIALLGF